MREFIDVSHPEVEEDYDSILEIEGMVDAEDLILELQDLIDRDPFYFDPVVYLHNLHLDFQHFLEAGEVLLSAYQRALSLILDDDRQWPAKLSWDFIENRHVIRLLEATGRWYWRRKTPEKAMDLFRNLLRTNPNDNLGVRFYLLAIKLGWSFKEFEERLNKNRETDTSIFEWFEREHSRFPEEFKNWK